MSDTLAVLGTLAPDELEALRSALDGQLEVVATGPEDSVLRSARYLVVRDQPADAHVLQATRELRAVVRLDSGSATVDEAECRRLGPLIENHPAFPNRTNVQFARASARDQLDILIWERGAGYTLASGTSSCGAASAAVKNGLCAHGRVKVRMPGGELTIEVRPDWSLRLDGPVEEVYQGTLSAEFAASL